MQKLVFFVVMLSVATQAGELARIFSCNLGQMEKSELSRLIKNWLYGYWFRKEEPYEFDNEDRKLMDEVGLVINLRRL